MASKIKEEKEIPRLLRLRIFMWYLLTEPIRFVIRTFKVAFLGITHTSASKNWMLIYLVLFVAALYADNKISTMICLIVVLILFLRNQWKSGTFIYRYRELKKQDGGKEE